MSPTKGGRHVPADERPLRQGLSDQRILKEALALVDEAGLDALTTRALGHRLGVDATAVYRYFRNKDELINALGDRIIGSGTPPLASTDGSGWPRLHNDPQADLALLGPRPEAMLQCASSASSVSPLYSAAGHCSHMTQAVARLAFLIIRAVVPSEVQVVSAMAMRLASRRPSDPHKSGLSCLNHASPRVGGRPESTAASCSEDS